MAAQEVMVAVRDFGCVASSSRDGFERQVSFKESENLGVDLLDDFDSYFEDINGRLTISRMVSDSVIKGMVKAVEQMAAEKIAAKELEVVTLREMIQLHQLGTESELSGALVEYDELGSKERGFYHSLSDTLIEHDKITESLNSLRSAARGQIKRLKKEIDCIRGHSPVRRISSGSELVGLGEILQEKASESLVGVDKTLDNLTKTVDAMCTQVDEMVHLAKASLCEWQEEQEFQRELEATVTQCLIRSFHEEFEEKLWNQSMNWVEKMNEVSNLIKELDAIIKSLPNAEAGQPVSHGSHDGEHLQLKALRNHVAPSSSVWEDNDIFKESNNGVPENWDAAQLKHMSRDELVTYFNTMITKMKRNHESKVHELTEESYRLKREFLKEKGSSVPIRRDKDFDILRKKIPDVILKLDNVLMESEKNGLLSHNSDTLGGLNDRFSNLLLENYKLRDSLSDKRKEVKCLSSQVSDAAEKILQHSLAEKNFLELIGNLKSSLADTVIEAAINESVYTCVLKELASHVNYKSEELEIQSMIMQDIDSLVMQGISGDIFREVINELKTRYLHEHENRVLLELKAVEKDKELRLVILEKERLTQEVQSLVAAKEDKEKLIVDLKERASSLQLKAVGKSKEIDSMKAELAELRKQIEANKVVINHLNKNLERVQKQLMDTDKEKQLLLAVQKQRMQEVGALVHGLSGALSCFKSQVAEKIQRNNYRLEESNSQLSSLKRTALLYKKRLERRCADLQMAEAEVDLLGDEVDALSRLLEKIYIALDHYSPILKHYPGIMEILKLVRRELSGESTNSV